ncbi:MAG: hypothetical protein IJ639_13100 [Ruminococcus sp.]|nr:hypothetical protein [Ruminococcus sp.]
MKKFCLSFMTGVMLLVMLCLQPFTASAAQAALVEIPVEIEGGGTAVIIPEVNCPVPDQTSIEVSNGLTENINITFSEAGEYSYTIRVESKDGLYYSPAYYIASVTVRKNADGKLYAMTVLTKSDSDYKPDACAFTRAEKPSVDPTQSEPTEAVTPTQPQKNPPTSRPKTGDDSMLDLYLLICILASGGLFALSVIYLVSTNRLIGKR